MKTIIQKSLQQSYSYAEYRQLIQQLLSEGKTTGPKQSETMTHYTQLNEKRMTRLDKRDRLTPALREVYDQLDKDYLWLVITEGWCGDASQIVPIINAVAESSPKLNLRLALRDDNPELMDLFMINGTRSIPVLVTLDPESLEVVAVWGARPKPAQSIVDEYKKLEVKPPYAELSANLQRWYNRDKTQTLQEELIDLAQHHLLSKDTIEV